MALNIIKKLIFCFVGLVNSKICHIWKSREKIVVIKIKRNDFENVLIQSVKPLYTLRNYAGQVFFHIQYIRGNMQIRYLPICLSMLRARSVKFWSYLHHIRHIHMHIQNIHYDKIYLKKIKIGKENVYLWNFFRQKKYILWE